MGVYMHVLSEKMAALSSYQSQGVFLSLLLPLPPARGLGAPSTYSSFSPSLFPLPFLCWGVCAHGGAHGRAFARALGEHGRVGVLSTPRSIVVTPLIVRAFSLLLTLPFSLPSPFSSVSVSFLLSRHSSSPPSLFLSPVLVLRSEFAAVLGE